MAATEVTGSAVISVTSAYSTTGTTLAPQAADASNGNYVAGTTDVFILAINSGGATHDVTITSVADPTYGRTGDATKNMGAGTYQVFRLTPSGWKDTNDRYNFSADHSDVKFGVIKLR